jgi:hypothetical protein
MTAFTFEKVNGIFAARSAGYSKDDSSYRDGTVPGPLYGGAPLIDELTQICDIAPPIPVCKGIPGRDRVRVVFSIAGDLLTRSNSSVSCRPSKTR